MNKFLDEIDKIPSEVTKNGALAYATTNSVILDYFNSCNNLHRKYEEVEKDLNKCWEENSELTLRLIGYIRAITRTSKDLKFDVKGLGLKNEGRLGLRWLYINHKEVFYKNIKLVAEYGSWADFWHKDFTDWIDNKDEVVAKYISYSLIGNNLCRKYLPRYKSRSNIKRGVKSLRTIEFKLKRNKGLYLVVDQLNKIFNGETINMKSLMKMKVEGTSHSWQQHISKGNFNNIDFNLVPGKVLTWMSKKTNNGSFLSRNKLEDKYIEWLETKDSLNTTSYLYELVKPAIDVYNENYGAPKTLSKVQQYTIEKQLQTILNKSIESNLNVMPVLDTSGSMGITMDEKSNVNALDIAMSLGVYFSMIQSGTFKDTIIAFDSTSKFYKLNGDYLNRIKALCREEDFMGSTNFQSVIDLVVTTRKRNPSIPIEDYPQVYLVISDMQFDQTDYYNTKTNHEMAVCKLIEAGLPRPLFIWYNVSYYGNGNHNNIKDEEGVIQISGFDPSIINQLMSKDFQLKFEEKSNKSLLEITPYEALIETLSQPYLLEYIV